MIITVNRFTSDQDTTLSAIYLNNKFECFGLEDEYREHKLPRETRIPPGRYKVGLRTVGGFHNRYKDRFLFHMGMLEIQNVPGFEYILIHVGNTDEDTAGCLLVGTGCYADQGNMSVQASVNAYKAFYTKVVEHALMDDLEIHIIDEDLRKAA